MNDKYNYMDALAFYAGTDNHYACGYDGDGKIINLDWHADNQKAKPTTAQLDVIIISLETEYDNNKYQRDRKEEYPSTGDQLDYIFHHGVEKWKEDMIIPVKNKYPKE